METVSQELNVLFEKAGIALPPETPNIGRELSYSSLKRTVVVHFSEEDAPVTISRSLEAIFSIEPTWFCLNRHGEPKATKFTDSSVVELLSKLTEAWSQMACVKDDLYLVSGDGKVLVSYVHHISEDGLTIFFNDVEKAGLGISELNSIGAEFEVFSNIG